MHTVVMYTVTVVVMAVAAASLLPLCDSYVDFWLIL